MYEKCERCDVLHQQPNFARWPYYCAEHKYDPITVNDVLDAHNLLERVIALRFFGEV